MPHWENVDFFAGWLFFVVFIEPVILIFECSACVRWGQNKINTFLIKLSSATLHKSSITYNICTQCGQIKRKRICDVEWVCFALFTSLYWILNMHDKYCLIICDSCSWVSACVWSIVFIPNMLALNLGKHFYLPEQSSACYTKRLITVFWLLLCQSVRHCWRGLEQKNPTCSFYSIIL